LLCVEHIHVAQPQLQAGFIARQTGRAAHDFSLKGIGIASGTPAKEKARNAWTQLFGALQSDPPERGSMPNAGR
jgi:hypothetical protein